MTSRLFAAVLLALSQCALAQQPPGAGGQLQQIPPPPAPERSLPDIRIEPPATPSSPAAESLRVRVDGLRVAGATVFSESELVAAAGLRPGSELTVADLRAMAARITEHYRRNGYFVAQAYVPAQDIRDGVVTLNVVEGRYGRITLKNDSSLRDSLPNGLLAGLNPGDTISLAPLESRLLLLSDIAGVTARSTLIPGDTAGTSDLLVDVAPGRRVTGSVEADNAGNRYTGEYRVGATVNINNPFGLGDVISLRGLTTGDGLNYGRASYQLQLGRATLGVAYAGLEYELGKEFASLRAHGTAQIASVYGSYPLLRSRNTNLYAVAGYDWKEFQDKVDATSTVIDREARVAMFGLQGNHRDDFLGGGLSSASVSLSSGEIDIITPAALAVDAATARSNGDFHKVSYGVARLQSVTRTLLLYGSITGQIASKNLDISEKMVLGGAYGVRAYPVGEAYADEGYLATLEARLLLPQWERLPGQTHFIGFADTGTVKINKEPWAAGDNSRTLSGAGLGLSWADHYNFVVRAFYAWKVGSEAATSAPDRNGRFWVQLVKYF